MPEAEPQSVETHNNGDNPLSPDAGVRRLPAYTRSLLRIKVPVIVTLATAKQSLHDIVEIVPGSIIQFDKSCDETLSLEVANRTIATGEAVKVGDKYGLRLTSMVLPEERFHAIRKAATAGSRQD